MPHSSPGSSTTSFSRDKVLSASRTVRELGSGTCLTMKTIFTRQPPVGERTSQAGRTQGALSFIIAASKFATEAFGVLGSIAAAEQLGVEAFEPGHGELLGEVGSPVPTGINSGSDRMQRRLPVRGACRLRPATYSWDRGIAAGRC